MDLDFTQIYEQYKGQWVALDKSLKNVIASDKSAKGAYNKALKKGYKVPTLFKVPKENLPYFGSNTA